MQHYDYILAGGGMAGLSLAYYLNQSELRTKRILIIDREPKLKNDRTWAFWEEGPGPFDAILHQNWGKVWFYGPRGDGPRKDGPPGGGTTGFSQQLDLTPYRYKLLRGLDFYQFVHAALALNSTIEFLYSPILRIGSGDEEAFVETEAGRFSADWVFDSTFRLDAMKPFGSDFKYLPTNPLPTGPPQLLQHFKGWLVRTKAPVFDPAAPVMMDFRVEQHGECRFMYVLPGSTTEALVEFTLFTPALLPPDVYDSELKNYLRDFLNISEFEVLESEFGIIPMSDEPTHEHPAPRVVRIGTAGGTTRPSTGYTFSRTQRRLQAIAGNLLRFGQPFAPGGRISPIPTRFLVYDRIFLNVFLKHRHAAADVFTRLYAHNRPAALFRFLDEQTSFSEELRVMWAAPKLPFVRAALDVLWQKIVPRPKTGQ